MLPRFTRLVALKPRPHRVRRWRSTTAGKTLSDFIQPFIDRVKSGMKALVVYVKYGADHDEAKKPVVTIQVAKNLVGRTADEDNEFPQGTHLDRRRVAFEPLYMRASGGALWSRPSGASAVILAKRVSHKPRRDACASRSEWRKSNLHIADARRLRHPPRLPR